MFTPQRGGWPAWVLPSSTDKKDSSNGNKGKLISSEFPSPAAGNNDVTPMKNRIEAPPIVSLDDNGKIITTPQTETRRSFRDVGNLDDNSILKKDPVALLMHISNMEAELYDYQYNMGLLLMERKEWGSKCDKLKATVSEAEEKLKKEASAHMVAFSEAEKHGETLKKALAVEKQCVTDLEKALKETRAENAELKVMVENKCAQARDMVASTEERSLLAESKLHSAQALEAEAARNKADAERKLQEVEAREDALRRERQSYRAEHEAHESELNRERQSLCDWEKKLQEGQERLLEGQRLLNQREEHANRKEELLQQLEKDLQDTQKDVEEKKIVLQQLESDLNARLSALVIREENEVKREISIDKKEQELLLLQEKLANRERKEKELDEKAKATSERDQLLKSEKKQLGAERKVAAEERRSLMILKGEIEILNKQMEVEKEQVLDEREKLRVTEQERNDLLNMQQCLKEEIDVCRAETKVVSMQAEELKKDRELFEREWDILDEKREQIRKELEQAEKEKKRVAKWLQDEEARLKQEKNSLRDQICRDTEALRLEKEAFVSTMEHERREWFTKVEKEREDLVRDMDARKREFERSIEKRKEDLDKQMKQRELRFKMEAETERQNLAALKALAEKELDDACQEKYKLDKERQEIAKYREDSEKDWIGIREDIEELHIQREKLKEQREALKRERLEIFQSAENQKREKQPIVLDDSLKNEQISDRNNMEGGSPEMGLLSTPLANGVVPGRGNTSQLSNTGKPALESTPGKVLGTRFSWLQKCASVLFHTPDRQLETENIGTHTENHLESVAELGAPVDVENQIAAPGLNESNHHNPFLETEGDHSRLDESNQPDNSLENEEDQSLHPFRSSRSLTPDQVEEIDESQLADLRGKEKCIKRTRSICAVVEDAKAILDSSLAPKGNKEDFVGEEDVGNTDDGDKRFDLHVSINVERGKDRKPTKQTRKWHRQQQMKQQSKGGLTEKEIQAETESEVATTGKRKRQQRESGNIIKGEEGKETPGVKRYNLRHSTIAYKTANQQVSSGEKVVAEHRRQEVANKLQDTNNGPSMFAVETEPQEKETGLDANGELHVEEPDRQKERVDFSDAFVVPEFAFSCENVPNVTHHLKTVDRGQDVQEDDKEEDIRGAVFDEEEEDETVAEVSEEDNEEGKFEDVNALQMQNEVEDEEIGQQKYTLREKLWDFFTT